MRTIPMTLAAATLLAAGGLTAQMASPQGNDLTRDDCTRRADGPYGQAGELQLRLGLRDADNPASSIEVDGGTPFGVLAIVIGARPICSGIVLPGLWERGAILVDGVVALDGLAFDHGGRFRVAVEMPTVVATLYLQAVALDLYDSTPLRLSQGWKQSFPIGAAAGTAGTHR